MSPKERQKTPQWQNHLSPVNICYWRNLLKRNGPTPTTKIQFLNVTSHLAQGDCREAQSCLMSSAGVISAFKSQFTLDGHRADTPLACAFFVAGALGETNSEVVDLLAAHVQICVVVSAATGIPSERYERFARYICGEGRQPGTGPAIAALLWDYSGVGGSVRPSHLPPEPGTDSEPDAPVVPSP